MSRRRTKTLTALATTTLLSGLLVGLNTPAPAAEEPAQPCQDAPIQPVKSTATFNDPAGGEPTRIVRHICSLVKQAPPGAQIRIGHFVISGEAGMDFVRELIDAHERGVDVKVVIDGWQVDNPAMQTLRQTLGSDESTRSWVHVCSRLSPEGSTSSCIGTKGNHNKFYLFSQTADARQVVVQSSANFTDLNSTTYWNNALTLRGNERLYEAYRSYFDDLAAEVDSDDYYRTVTTGMAGGYVRAHFFPRADGDPILEQLAKVACDTDTTIRIAMSEWDDYRIAIAHRLVDLAREGCTVDIVHGKMDASVANALASSPGVRVRELNRPGELPGYVHSKYMTIEGSYDGEHNATRVITGSPNFNQTSLRRNDEAMLDTNLRWVFDQYQANFARLWDVAAAQ
jgi:hypothetical protein